MNDSRKKQKSIAPPSNDATGVQSTVPPGAKSTLELVLSHVESIAKAQPDILAELRGLGGRVDALTTTSGQLKKLYADMFDGFNEFATKVKERFDELERRVTVVEDDLAEVMERAGIEPSARPSRRPRKRG